MNQRPKYPTNRPGSRQAAGESAGGQNLAPTTAAQVLVQGLARLAEGQRCFADEFGLNYGRVFRDEFEQFKGKNPETVIRQWLKEGESGTRRLQGLLDDLLRHQLALVGALEGIAVETVEQLSPQRIEKSSPGLLGLRPFAWRCYRKLHRQYVQNQQLRHQNLVLTGFVTGYIREREKQSQSS
jgi:hypothetical protein